MDAVLLYDTEGANVSFASSRTPGQNIYVGLQTSLLDGVDPTLDAAISRLTGAYEKTFWAIPRAYDFGRACQALAKRGHNIHCLTLYWGPGGVGLSLYTAHLQAMYGSRNHKIFDPNIFCDDNELRKQVQLMLGAIIYTGQERPIGNRHNMREDLLKKFATGEGIAGRPYV